MTPRTKKTVAALGGALVLASGAYALGSQAGDGAALAGGTTTSARQPAAGPRGPGHDLSDAAARLGVTEAKLRAALEDLRPDRRDDRHADLAAALAKELGLSTAKVQTALEKQHGERKLDRDDRRADRRDEFAQALARKLGVAESKVRSALEATRPDGRRGGRPDLGVLATAIGVSQAKLTTAFENIRDEMEKQHEARRAAFVKQLAAKLGVSEAKVEEVVGDGPHH